MSGGLGEHVKGEVCAAPPRTPRRKELGLSTSRSTLSLQNGGTISVFFFMDLGRASEVLGSSVFFFSNMPRGELSLV